MATYKISQEEMDFLLTYVPAYGTLDKDGKRTLMTLMGKVSARQASGPQLFRLYKHKNPQNAVPCIKLIRHCTGMGLKEAKDAWDAETTFNLTDWKMGKEQLEAFAKTIGAGIVIDFL